MNVKRFPAPAFNSGEPVIVVLASDYDALATELQQQATDAQEDSEKDQARIAQLETALRKIANQSAQDYEDPEEEAYASRDIARTVLETDCDCAAPAGMPHMDTCRTKYK